MPDPKDFPKSDEGEEEAGEDEEAEEAGEDEAPDENDKDNDNEEEAKGGDEDKPEPRQSRRLVKLKDKEAAET